MENDFDFDISKPNWCPLIEVKEGANNRADSQKWDNNNRVYKRSKE